MYFLDKSRNIDGSKIFRTKSAFNYPVQKNKNGEYKVKSGEMLRVCLTSDFFLEDADIWRDEVWEIMRKRSDVVFYLLTKRPERVEKCLPYNWNNGWENIFFNITVENQIRADERIPILKDLPFKHKGIMTAPLLEKITIEKYLSENFIEQVLCGGENYENARPCNFDWVKHLQNECILHNVTFVFHDIGYNFVKDGKTYRITDKETRYRMAEKSQMSFQGKPINFKLTPPENQQLDFTCLL
jgi:protein gp37